MNSTEIVSHAVPHTWSSCDEPRKMALSTGRFPPTPIDQSATNDESDSNDGAPPAASANTPIINRVILKDGLETC